MSVLVDNLVLESRRIVGSGALPAAGLLLVGEPAGRKQ